MSDIFVDSGWVAEGYEWPNQAGHCGKGYESWKQSLVDSFILPNIGPDSTFLEIGAGAGRWARRFLSVPALLWLVEPDPVARAILADRCSNRIEGINILANDGRTLAGVPSRSVDFVWSYDVFVHLRQETAVSYLEEIHRVLKTGGRATVHYATRTGAGGRSALNQFPDMASACGLRHMSTVDSWGEGGSFNCRLFGDQIATFAKG